MCFGDIFFIRQFKCTVYILNANIYNYLPNTNSITNVSIYNLNVINNYIKVLENIIKYKNNKLIKTDNFNYYFLQINNSIIKQTINFCKYENILLNNFILSNKMLCLRIKNCIQNFYQNKDKLFIINDILYKHYWAEWSLKLDVSKDEIELFYDEIMKLQPN